MRTTTGDRALKPGDDVRMVHTARPVNRASSVSVMPTSSRSRYSAAARASDVCRDWLGPAAPAPKRRTRARRSPGPALHWSAARSTPARWRRTARTTKSSTSMPAAALVTRSSRPPSSGTTIERDMASSSGRPDDRSVGRCSQPDDEPGHDRPAGRGIRRRHTSAATTMVAAVLQPMDPRLRHHGHASLPVAREDVPVSS